MPVASERVRRVCAESARSIMWGWCSRITAIGPVVQPTTMMAWHGCWDLLLTEDLGVWMAPVAAAHHPACLCASLDAPWSQNCLWMDVVAQ